MLATLLFVTAAIGGLAVPDTIVPLRRGASVEIDAPTCAVVVRVGAEGRLVVTGGGVELSGNRAEVDCDSGTKTQSRTGGETVTVTLPPAARVEIGTTGGDITVIGLTDRLDVTTIYGEIRVTGGGGRTTLESVAGTITVSEYHGVALAAEAVAGVVVLQNVEVSGLLSAESVNGNVQMRGIRAGGVTGTSVNGTVDFAGTFDPAGNYAFESHNGGITLTLPEAVSAKVRISSFLGKFDTEIKGTLMSGSRQATLAPTAPPMMENSDFTIVFGKGEARVSVESFNGAIRVKAAK